MHRFKLSLAKSGTDRTVSFFRAVCGKRLTVLSVPFLLLLSAGLTFAQSEAQIESEPVRRVASHINCQCGSCNNDANCMMSGGQCHFCKPARTQIFQMQQEGKSDEEIVAAFIKQYGEKIFRPDPNSTFWMVPYVGLALGGVLIVWILARMRAGSKHTLQPAAGPPVADDDPSFARYRDAIEKDTDRLE